MASYEIAFAGQLVPGAQGELVKANLAKLFQADTQRIALLFSGRRIVIKNNLDAAGAEKYRATLERAGALVEVSVMPVAGAAEQPARPAEPSQVQAPTAAGESRAESAPGRLKVLPRDEYMAAFAEVDAPDFGIAPLGDDLQDDKPDAQAPELDLTQFSLAPPGSDMGQARTEPAAAPPDISHLKLQE